MSNYFESILPEPFVILGRELKPLTIGHLLILNRLGCLPSDDDDKLFIAVLVCSTDSTSLDDLFNDKWLDIKLWWWRFRLGNINWLRCHELWLDYFLLHMEMPSFISKEDKSSEGPPSGTPFLQQLKATLQSKLNYSPSEALSTPFQKAVWDYVSYHELEGNIEVMDKDYRASMKEEADRMHDEVVKQYKEGLEDNGS